MKGFRSLSTKLVVAMLIPLSILLLVATWIETRTAGRAMIQTGEIAATNLANAVKEELQGVLRSTKASVNALSLGLSRLPSISEEESFAVLREELEQFPLVYGATLAFEPGVDGDPPPLAPYVYRKGDTIAAESLAGDDYRYWEWDWYTRPLEQNQSVWSAPYFDEGGGNVRMVTYSRPLVINQRRAVLTADLELGFLTEIAGSSLLGRPGAVLVFDARGRLVAHPRNDWLLERSLNDIAREYSLPALDLVTAAIARGESYWLRPDDGMHAGLIGGDSTLPGRLLLMPLKEAGWGIGVYFSDHDFLAEVEAATRFKLLFALTLLIMLASVLALVSLKGLKPLGELADRTRAIAQGKFHGDTPGLKRKDEIGSLSRAFHSMQEQLQSYIDDLTRATAARERLQAELATARLIQHALLPDNKPDIERTGVELQALLLPAREVGGDLYSYTRLDSERLFFAIGDVSDKGVPAALFMSRANALLHAASAQADSPARVLEQVNRELSEDNALCMFVTLLAGILWLKDGRLLLASAGHDSPIRVSADGEIGVVEVESASPAGVNDEARYHDVECHLKAGEALVTYTDGVTEARNSELGLFGLQRLMDAIRSASDNAPPTLLQAITAAVEAHSGGAAQSDDLTLLVFRYPGPGTTA